MTLGSYNILEAQSYPSYLSAGPYGGFNEGSLMTYTIIPFRNIILRRDLLEINTL